jgi:hypothetical protein
MPVEEFVGVRGTWFTSEPPFEHVRIGDQVDVSILRMADLRFVARAIDPEEL